MVALTKDRNTQKRMGDQYNAPLAAAVKIFAGSIVMLNASGDATPGAVATTLKPGGRAMAYVDNSTGAAGDKSVGFEKGVFKFANDGTITRADIGGTAWVVDDQTVADNNGTATRSALGTIKDVDADGAWVEIV